MEKTVHFARESKIFEKWLAKVDIDSIVSWLENEKDEEKFKFEAGCYLFNEMLGRIDFEKLRQELATKANNVYSENQLVIIVFTCLMKTAKRERDKKNDWLKEKRSIIKCLVKTHGDVVKSMMAQYENILEEEKMLLAQNKI